MASDTDVSELLLRWRDLKSRDVHASPEALCGDRPELLAELRRRIEAIEAMEQRLGVGAPADVDPVDSDVTIHESRQPERDGIGLEQVRIPGHEILGVIDRGGMGIVYKARQVKLKRLVAVKMIRSETHARPQHLARFRVEAEAVAHLQHPHIVQIYEVGDVDDKPFFSMEFVEGGSLARKIAGQPMPPVQAAEIVATLAEAIHFAHQRGVIHRDLKPANILLTTEGKPKISDFGLAKLLNREMGLSHQGAQTQSGVIMGTPSYMAPEQAEGKTKEIGPLADIYALGTILYEMLTGKPPFAGDTPLDTLLRVVSREPVPPSREQPKVPRDLETICLKCLEKSPQRRYATALTLAEDLRNFLGGQPINARSMSPIQKGVKWARHRREWLALAVVVGVIGLALLDRLLSWQRDRDAAHDIAVRLAPRAWEILHKNCYACHGQGGVFEGKLDVLDHALLIERTRKLVVPGDIKGSRLIHRIEDNSMPPEEEEEFPRMSSEEIEELKKWVLGGAPPFPPPDADALQPAKPAPELARDVKEIFREKCRDCHQFGIAKNGIKILNYDLLVAKRKVVVPFAPEQSPLYQSLFSKDPKKVMPPPDQLQLSDEEVDMIRRWIAEGAPAFPAIRKPRPN